MQADQIHQLGEKIGTNMAKAEEMGADGMVDESLKLMEEIEDIKKQKAQLEVTKVLCLCNSCIVCLNFFATSRTQLFDATIYPSLCVRRICAAVFYSVHDLDGGKY